MIRTPITPPLRDLVSAHPEPEVLLAAIHHANPAELAAIGRLWLTEGIPAAFAACPMEYEHIRALIADGLKISPCSVSMVGSARIGFSLAPKKFPRKLLAESDLDIFIVDSALFEGCMQAAERWRDDVTEGRVVANGQKQASNWEKIFAMLAKRRSYGFCDPWRYHRDYSPFREIRETMQCAKAALVRCGQVREVSARVYADWDRVLAKICFDLRGLRTEIPATVAAIQTSEQVSLQVEPHSSAGG